MHEQQLVSQLIAMLIVKYDILLSQVKDRKHSELSVFSIFIIITQNSSANEISI